MGIHPKTRISWIDDISKPNMFIVRIRILLIYSHQIYLYSYSVDILKPYIFVFILSRQDTNPSPLVLA